MPSEEQISVAIIPEFEVDEALDAKLRAFLCELFPNWESIFKTRRTWHDAKPIFTVLATDKNGAIAGHVAIVERTISTEWNCRYPVASVQGVSVAPERRGRGLARKLIGMALDESRRIGYLYAILFCREPLVQFYSRLGWKLPYDPMIMWRDRELPIHMQSDYPMYYELTQEPFPGGSIDVHNPF